MAELSRPFVILILPVWLVGGYQVLRGLPWRYHAAFVVPIVIISGVWHINLLVEHGQITATNHSGYNLSRAWG
jgi:hypothetical protein